MNEVPLRLSWAVLKEFQATAMGCVSNIRTVSQVDPFPAPPFPNIVYKSKFSSFPISFPIVKNSHIGDEIFSSRFPIVPLFFSMD
jgi:hypothetical protein